MSNVGIYVQPRTGNVNVTGSILPSACNVYDLGSASARWRDLYLSGNTIDLGGTRISREPAGGGINIRTGGGSGGTALADLSVNALTTSNLTVLNAYSTNYQIAPIRSTTYVNVSSRSSFVLSVPGYFGGHGSNVLAFVDAKKLTYLSESIRDYSLVVSYNNDPGNSQTFYTITLTQPAVFGNLVDITVWPQILPESLPNPMRMYQRVDVQSDFVSSGLDLTYMAGNVGIGTGVPTKKLHVVGDILTTGTLTASNVSVVGDFVILNTVTSNTEQMVIENAGTGPGLKVTQTGANSIAEFYDDGGVLAMKVADGGNVGIGTGAPTTPLHIQGHATIAGTVRCDNGLMFRNRAVNGDMKLDQINAGKPGTRYGPDGFEIVGANSAMTVVAQQVLLSDSDRMATGGFTHAAALTTMTGPTRGLIAYMDFNDRLTDFMGGLPTPTVTGSVQYVTGVIQTATGNAKAIYLANEGNVLPTSTKAANMVTYPFVQTSPLTVAYWIQFTKLPALNQYSIAMCFGNTTTRTIVLIASYNSNSSANLTVSYTNIANITPQQAIASGVWYHIAATYVPSTSYSFYLNGLLIGTVASGVPASLGTDSFRLGDSTQAAELYPFAGYIDDLRIYNRALGSGEIALLAGVPSNITTAPSGTSLISYYPFNNSTAESSGNAGGTTLTTTGSVSYVAGFDGAVNGAVYLANENNIQSTPTKAANYLSGSFTQTGVVTLALWIYVRKLPAASGKYCTLVNFGTTSVSGYGITILYSSATVATIMAYGNTSTGTTNIMINQWYHVVGVFIPSVSASLYVNGTHISTVANTKTTYTGILTVGENTNTANAEPYAGYVDDLRVYNRALRADEIAYLAGNSVFPVIPSLNLKSQYPFDGNITDNLGSISLVPVGTMQYVDGVIGSRALYLANEANVLAATSAANYLTGTYAFPLTYTVSLWAYSTAVPTTANWNMLFYTTNTGSSLTNAVFVGFFGTSASYTINCGFAGAANTTSGFKAVQNTWYQFTITYSNGTLSLYINGDFSGSTSGTMAQNGFSIGTNAPTGTQSFAGYIDDFRIYTYAMTASEVSRLYFGTANIASMYASLLNATPTPAVLYRQTLPGVNVSDFMFGTNSAQPVSASMWIKNKTTCSQTFTISLNNANTSSRSYVVNTTSIATNSWTKVAFTIPGDVTGTWTTSTTTGWAFNICLGANNNAGAGFPETWSGTLYHTLSGVQSFGDSGTMLSIQNNEVYVTGVQLEKGTLVTPYEYRPYGVESLNVRGGMMTTGSTVKTLTGTSVVFAGIPPWVKRITVVLNGIRTNGASANLIQLGSGGVIQSSGYLSYWTYTATGSYSYSGSTGFGFHNGGNNDVKYTVMTIVNISGTTWASSHSGGMTNGTTNFSISGGGNVTLIDVVDQLRLTTVNGTDVFTAGSVNILYE